MSKQPVSGRESLAAHPHENPTASAPPAARTAPQARADGGRNEAEQDASGAPPTNRAPDNSNQGDIDFKALRNNSGLM